MPINDTNPMTPPAHSHEPHNAAALLRREQPIDRKLLMERLWAAIDGKK